MSVTAHRVLEPEDRQHLLPRSTHPASRAAPARVPWLLRVLDRPAAASVAAQSQPLAPPLPSAEAPGRRLALPAAPLRAAAVPGDASGPPRAAENTSASAYNAGSCDGRCRGLLLSCREHRRADARRQASWVLSLRGQGSQDWAMSFGPLERKVTPIRRRAAELGLLLPGAAPPPAHAPAHRDGAPVRAAVRLGDGPVSQGATLLLLAHAGTRPAVHVPRIPSPACGPVETPPGSRPCGRSRDDQPRVSFHREGASAG